MKALLVCRSDREFGADRAAYRLHQGLRMIGVDSEMLVQNKLSDDSFVTGTLGSLEKKLVNFRETFDALPVKFYPSGKDRMFWPSWFPDRMQSKVAKMEPDVINLHWLCRGYMQIETLAQLKKPLIWTCHDMWAFTGGCNYSEQCDRYRESCGKCPQLQSSKNWDLSRWVWHRKAKAWKNLTLTIVTPSQWLAQCVRASSLFKERRVEVIPNGIDLEKYRPIDRVTARKLLKLPQDKHLVLFGAISATSDRRKGFHLLQPALESLRQSKWQERIELVVFGSSGAKDGTDLGFKSHYLGKLSDDLSLALVYAAANVFVAPSLQDNLPNTVMEAMSCGTPCVAFNIGGMPDMIEHQQNGYLAPPYEIEALAYGIVWVLENPERHARLSHRAREKAEQEFSLERQARSYSSVFAEMVSAKVGN